jgi:hypothetical protein
MSGLFFVSQRYKSLSPSQIADEAKIRSPQHCSFDHLSHDELEALASRMSMSAPYVRSGLQSPSARSGSTAAWRFLCTMRTFYSMNWLGTRDLRIADTDYIGPA